uniref:Peptidase S1 domain-containing protein n=1 Tax=Amphiprion ocellaris TaxID=80972 RepID=A0A3Q1CXD0_AMPOC
MYHLRPVVRNGTAFSQLSSLFCLRTKQKTSLQVKKKKTKTKRLMYCPVLFNDGRRIVGGTLAPKDKWGWQVSLHFRKTHTCGGAIISTHWIITAAHCFVDKRVLRMRIKWCIDNGRMDVLLFVDGVRPVCLPRRSDSFPPGTPCWITGWGVTTEGGWQGW